MKKLIVLFFLALTSSAYAQYPGPPMWSRDYRDYRSVRPRPYGPQMEDCIYRGECRGPRPPPRGYGMPPFRYPPPPPRYDDD
jgi:hypothetical protein